MVYQQQSRYKAFNNDLENLAESSWKDESLLHNGFWPRWVVSEAVPTSNANPYKVVKKQGFSISVSKFLLTAALCYFYLANGKAFNNANVMISGLKSEIEEMRIAENEFVGQASVTLKEINVLQLFSHRVQEAAADYQIRRQMIEKLQTHTQNFSNHYRDLLEKRFGPGPYYVEVDVLLDGKTRFFTVQTSSTYSMHQTVYMFMDMMDQKVWDNYAFVESEDQVLHIAPISPDGERHEGDRDMNIFEPVENNPREKNSLCFSRIGPGMYLNLKDLHDPFQQNENEILNDGPCFANVVIGLSTMSLLKVATSSYGAGDADSLIPSIKSIKRVEISEQRLMEYGL